MKGRKDRPPQALTPLILTDALGTGEQQKLSRAHPGVAAPTTWRD